MAIIECSECEKQISDKAAACPGCGAPVEKKKIPAKPLNPWFSALMICVVLLGILGYHSAKERAERKEQARIAAIQEAQARQREEAAAARIARAKAAALERVEQERRNAQQAKEDAVRQQRIEIAQGIALIIGQFQALNEVNQVASATPRIALSGQIARMQAILRETERLPIIGCLTPAKQSAVAGIRELINAYLSFMRQDSNTLQISRSAQHIKDAKGHMDACAEKSMARTL